MSDINKCASPLNLVFNDSEHLIVSNSHHLTVAPRERGAHNETAHCEGMGHNGFVLPRFPFSDPARLVWGAPMVTAGLDPAQR